MKIIYSFDGWTENHKFKYPSFAHIPHRCISRNTIKQWWKEIRHTQWKVNSGESAETGNREVVSEPQWKKNIAKRKREREPNAEGRKSKTLNGWQKRKKNYLRLSIYLYGWLVFFSLRFQFSLACFMYTFMLFNKCFISSPFLSFLCT